MTVLVLGGGGREHALVARLLADPGAPAVVCAPGNPGIARLVRTVPVSLTDPEAMLDLARRERADLTVVGPELPLSVGVADRFAAEGLLLVGPAAAAARLETSKAFAKAFMARHAVPTARFRTCDRRDAALEAVRSSEFGFPVVLKADGLAAGKGVVIARDLAEAEAAIDAAMVANRFGAAGHSLVIEECLQGPEVSYFVLSDGARALFLGSAQDHKRAFDEDEGPNTGGMGAFAPSPLMDAALEARVMREIVEPVIGGMAAEGNPFRGFLYVGLMLTAAGPKVIEFNVRLGDPEAQVILPRVASPLVPLLAAAASGSLADQSCRLSDEHLVGVVVAARGYPDAPETGRTIAGIGDAERAGASVLHAGTAMQGDALVTAGGRVATVVGAGATFQEAIARAYAGVRAIDFNGMHYRHDIGKKALV
ncbi:MAG: phosphoribosylamine--glycine ligase [Vicinamibacterales bacterium]